MKSLTQVALVTGAASGLGPKSLPVAVQRKLLASPTRVLDAIDAAIDHGQHISYPMPMAKWLYAMRRVSPALLWRVIERSEAAAS